MSKYAGNQRSNHGIERVERTGDTTITSIIDAISSQLMNVQTGRST